MSAKLDRLKETLESTLGDRLASLVEDRGQVTIEVAASNYINVARALRDSAGLRFEQMTDLCGLDYSDWPTAAIRGEKSGGKRFAIVLHLLSIAHNWRVRLRVFVEDDTVPVIASVCEVWPGANWYEREAYDMFGILFSGHEDMRRILTDYGFEGHPLRKDFPVSGHVEMRYDPEEGRVVYQPVTIEPRENTPRIVRESSYGGVGHG